jgi:hypothetical protein
MLELSDLLSGSQSMFSEDFVEPPCNQAELVELIVYFLDKTMYSAQHVKDIFSDNDPRTL